MGAAPGTAPASAEGAAAPGAWAAATPKASVSAGAGATKGVSSLAVTVWGPSAGPGRIAVGGSTGRRAAVICRPLVLGRYLIHRGPRSLLLGLFAALGVFFGGPCETCPGLGLLLVRGGFVRRGLVRGDLSGLRLGLADLCLGLIVRLELLALGTRGASPGGPGILLLRGGGTGFRILLGHDGGIRVDGRSGLVGRDTGRDGVGGQESARTEVGDDLDVPGAGQP